MRVCVKQRHRTRDIPSSNFFFRGLGIFIEKRFGGKNHAAQAIAALRGLLFDERFLNRVRLVDRAQTFESDDLGALHRFHRRDAGAHRLALHEDRAGSALSEAAAEFRAAQAEVVAQHVKQRRGRIDVEAVGLSVYFQSKEAHIPMKLLRSVKFRQVQVFTDTACKIFESPDAHSDSSFVRNKKGRAAGSTLFRLSKSPPGALQTRNV